MIIFSVLLSKSSMFEIGNLKIFQQKSHNNFRNLFIFVTPELVDLNKCLLIIVSSSAKNLYMCILCRCVDSLIRRNFLIIIEFICGTFIERCCIVRAFAYLSLILSRHPKNSSDWLRWDQKFVIILSIRMKYFI